MDNKQFKKQLEERTRKFAVSTIILSAKLPNTPEGKVVRNQIKKSGTSIGANYREANRARSKADLKIKLQSVRASHLKQNIGLRLCLRWNG